MSQVIGTVRNLSTSSALEFRNKANPNDAVFTSTIDPPGGLFGVYLGDGKTYSIYVVETGKKCDSPSRITVEGPMAICIAVTLEKGPGGKPAGELPGWDEARRDEAEGRLCICAEAEAFRNAAPLVPEDEKGG